jgi:hypothetical protein
MSDYLIVVANSACVRFFILEPVEFPELESGPRLTIRAEIENQEIKDVREIYTDSKTGRGATPQGGGVHGYGDKRNRYLDELRRRFAVKVFRGIQKLAMEEQARTVILAASARMRRFLYSDLDILVRQGCRVHKLSKNMINFSPQKIHEYLADDGLVPKQKKLN